MNHREPRRRTEADNKKWHTYRWTLQETLFYFPQRSFVKAFLVVLTLLAIIQPPALVFGGDTGEPPIPTSDSDYFYFHHDDHLGSSHILTEGKPEARHAGLVYKQGEILQRFEYMPFGQERFVLNPNLKFNPSYTGQTYDLETGLYYYKSLYYDPKLARFIQPDTAVPDAKNLQAYNRYSYVANNPLKFVDPSGHFWGWFKKIFGALIGALIGALTFGLLIPAGLTLATISLGQAIGFGVVSGLAGGLVGGAISGGLKGALLGAAFGVIGGALFGGIGHGLAQAVGKLGAFAILSGVSAGVSYITDGWKGLLTFGAGLIGAVSGGMAGAAIKGGRDYRLKLPKKNIGFDYKNGKPQFTNLKPVGSSPNTDFHFTFSHELAYEDALAVVVDTRDPVSIGELWTNWVEKYFGPKTWLIWGAAGATIGGYVGGTGGIVLTAPWSMGSLAVPGGVAGFIAGSTLGFKAGFLGSMSWYEIMKGKCPGVGVLVCGP